MFKRRISSTVSSSSLEDAVVNKKQPPKKIEANCIPLIMFTFTFTINVSNQKKIQNFYTKTRC